MGGGGRELIERGARGSQDLTLDALKNLPEPLKKPLRQAIGRVATNVIFPIGYEPIGDITQSKSQQIASLFTPRELAHTIKSIAKDEPAYKTKSPDPFLSQDYTDLSLRARRPLFREYFDLPTQDVDNVYIKHGKQYRINPESRNTIATGTIKELKDTRGEQRGAASSILGNFRTGQPDPWDFDVPPKELEEYKGKHLPLEIFGRLFLEAFGKPAVVQTGGYANFPPEEDPLSYMFMNFLNE